MDGKNNFKSRGKKRAFLRAYARMGMLRKVFEHTKISPHAHYDWLRNDPAYAEDFELARDIAADCLEDEIIRRARYGVPEPVGWYQGKAGGTIVRYSDNLAMFQMKSLRPERYRDNHHITVDHKVELTVDEVKRRINAIACSDPQLIEDMGLSSQVGELVGDSYKDAVIDAECDVVDPVHDGGGAPQGDVRCDAISPHKSTGDSKGEILSPPNSTVDQKEKHVSPAGKKNNPTGKSNHELRRQRRAERERKIREAIARGRL